MVVCVLALWRELSYYPGRCGGSHSSRSTEEDCPGLSSEPGRCSSVWASGPELPAALWAQTPPGDGREGERWAQPRAEAQKHTRHAEIHHDSLRRLRPEYLLERLYESQRKAQPTAIHRHSPLKKEQQKIFFLIMVHSVIFHPSVGTVLDVCPVCSGSTVMNRRAPDLRLDTGSTVES